MKSSFGINSPSPSTSWNNNKELLTNHTQESNNVVEEEGVTEIAVIMNNEDDGNEIIGRNLFKIIPNVPDGNCLFRAISQAVFNTETIHTKCRKDIVEFIVNEVWDEYYPHIQCQNENIKYFKESIKKHKTSSSNICGIWKKAYKNYMLQDKVYGNFQELIAASDLYRFNPVVIRQMPCSFFSIQNYKDYFRWDTTFHFLFTGESADDGHFEYLELIKNNGLNSIPLRRGYYKTCLEEDDPESSCIVIKEHFGPIPSFEERTPEEPPGNGNSKAIETPATGEEKTTTLRRNKSIEDQFTSTNPVILDVNSNPVQKIESTPGSPISSEIDESESWYIPPVKQVAIKKYTKTQHRNHNNHRDRNRMMSTTDEDSDNNFYLPPFMKPFSNKIHPLMTTTEDNNTSREPLLKKNVTNKNEDGYNNWKERIVGIFCFWCSCFPKST